MILLSTVLSACGQPAGSEVPAILEPTLRPTTSADSALPSAPAPASGEAQADVVFYNGVILTMDNARPTASAIHLQGERIVAVGDDASVLAEAGTTSSIVDLQGRTLTPGFINGHSHHISQRYKWGFDSLDQAVQSALGQGWTGLTELAVDQAELAELIEAAEAGRLPFASMPISW